MKRLFLVMGLMVISAPVLADCSYWSVGAPVGYANVRAQPSAYADILWTVNNVGNGSEPGTLTFCGHSTYDDRGIEWRWVSFHLQHENWRHSGWMSSKTMFPYIQTEPQDTDTGE